MRTAQIIGDPIWIALGWISLALVAVIVITVGVGLWRERRQGRR